MWWHMPVGLATWEAEVRGYNELWSCHFTPDWATEWDPVVSKKKRKEKKKKNPQN